MYHLNVFAKLHAMQTYLYSNTLQQ